MQIKKLFKYLPITVIAAGLAVAASTSSLPLLNNSDHLKNQIFNVDQAVDETEYTDQLQYIRNDVAKQTGVTNSVASINISNNNSSLSLNSAAIVTKTDGSTLLYMWGSNRNGQLGNGTTSPTSPTTTPTLVDSTPFGSRKITEIALGQYFSAALLEDGSLYMWGQNDYGQLGNGTQIDESTPTPVTALNDKNITKIALGFNHSAALVTETDGSTLLYMWGYNNNGQLGNGTTSRTSTPTPVNSAPFGTKKITQIALGGYYSGALATEADGSTLIYMWGLNDKGQLGNKTNVGVIFPNPNPILVNSTPFGSEKITQIALGEQYSAALVTKTDGSTLLYMWGYNNNGQLGNGTTENTPTPTLVDSTPFGINKITQIALGFENSAALVTKTDGSTLLYMWGNNKSGQLGFTVNTTPNRTPTLIDSTPFGSRKITQIALGFYHSAALLEDDSLYMWGDNFNGQLGNGTTSTTSTPTWVSRLGTPSNITAKFTITAKNAVDNLWVDNKFNLTGFKNSFNLINIPDATDQTFAIDTKPIYDNAIGTVTMNIKIKYYYDGNGLIVADTATTPMIISGFSTTMTNITVKTAPLSSIVVDKWLSYVTVDEKINRTKLEEFLTLTGVPADAVFTITNSKPINETGFLTFNISTSKIIDADGNVQNTPSIPFPITLNLTPRITKMTAITTGYPSNLLAADLKAELFNEDGLVIDLNVLSKYLIIVAPVDGATYHLVADSWEPSDDGKEVKFSIWVDKYYDADTNEQTGTETSITNRIDFDLQLTGVVIVPTDDQFPWWWIIVGIGGAGLIAVGTWFGIKKYKKTDTSKISPSE